MLTNFTTMQLQEFQIFIISTDFSLQTVKNVTGLPRRINGIDSDSIHRQ